MLCVLIIPNDLDAGYRVIFEQVGGMLEFLHIRVSEEIELDGTAYKIIRIRHSVMGNEKVVYVYLVRAPMFTKDQPDWVSFDIREQVSQHLLLTAESSTNEHL